MSANLEPAAAPGWRASAAGDVPAWIAFLFALDVALVAAPVIDFLVGSPFTVIRNWLDLDSEQSLPAWYSSMKWLVAALLFACVPLYLWRQRPHGLGVLASFALVCLVFSIDEIVGIHEWIGRRSDVLLPGGQRDGTAFERTGIWPFVVGIPVVAMLAALIISARRQFGSTYKVTFLRLIVGFAVMFTGALVVELGKNLIAVEQDSTGAALLQLSIEEFFEMVGVTVIIWAAYEFAYGQGFRLEPPTPEASRRT